ncbi:MAG: GatB/YqeY domain-containing protein [bacterium]
MTIRKRIQEDLKNSMKAKDGDRVSVLRLVLAAVKNREIELKSELDDEQILAEITSAAKRRKESIEAFKEGGREDLVLKEGKELAILEEYLPAQLSPEELKSLIQEAIESTGASSPGDMGKVMKEIMPRVQGKADGKVVNQKVKEILSS